MAYIAGESDAIGTTPNHPFWSHDKQKFIRADELTPGERLRKADGTLTTVTQITPRAGANTVYNLEIQLNHTYHVGKTGVLVHNGNTCPELLDPKLIRFSQNSIGRRTGLKGKYSVIQNAIDLKNNKLSFGTKSGQIPPIRIYQSKNGKIWTLDNRRLAAARMAGLENIPVVSVSKAEAVRELILWGKLSTINDGSSILIRLGRGNIPIPIK